jgi:hypothetical protein
MTGWFSIRTLIGSALFTPATSADPKASAPIDAVIRRFDPLARPRFHTAM